ncbi:polyprotein of retroviral origin [Aphelenchoides avenae]|nr:polyprotein of retroviral origin [Aphelenchus avenae]
MAPLYELMRKEGKITDKNGRIIGGIGKWTPECQVAFDTILEKLATAPVLAAPWIGHPYIIDIDASKVAFGACLMQKNSKGEIHPIWYASKLTNKSQAKLPSVELEAAALVWALLRCGQRSDDSQNG